MTHRFDWRSKRMAWLALGALLIGAITVAVLLVDRLSERRAVDAERDRLANVARLASSGYQSQVDKFQLVATTLSADPDVGNLLDRRSADAAGRLNRRLADLTTALDASVIYLLDDRGLTIAASNWRQSDNFVGENYGFRAYFQRALALGHWEQYALGTRSRVPGLYVARRVETASGSRGVIVVKIRFDRLEAEWAKSSGPAFVASEQGVILVTNRPEWRFETTGLIGAAERQRLTAQVEYGDAPLRQNALYANRSVVRSGAEYNRDTQFVAAEEKLANGWSVNLLAPVNEAVASARAFGRLVLAVMLAVMAALIAGYWLRARAIVARQQRETDRHIGELKERLVQANKLSTLGQIAAGVGHEINQPLTAIALRAQVARRLVSKGQIDQAGSVFDEIGALVARAGAITGELRRFARRARREPGRVLLSSVIEGTRLLLGDRLRSARTDLSVSGPDLAVSGEQGRLEQVFVNLIQNALDAMEPGGAIAITIDQAGAMARVTITDTGPGIPAAVRERLFQPFTSSKEDGLGLGLVICRDIVADLGGDLVCLPPDSGGAGFAITLRLAP